MNKKKKILLITLVIAATFVLAFIGIFAYYIASRYYILKEYAYMNKEIPTEFKDVDISMTGEERLADFEKAYEYAVLSNQSTPEFEKLYGIDYSEMYEEYRGYVSECNDEFDYYYVLCSFLRSFPSGHTALLEQTPEEMRSCGFEMVGVNGSAPNEDDYLNAWQNCLKEGCLRYDFENTTDEIFMYLNGEYMHDICDDKYNGSKLLKLNGEDIDEWVTKPLQYYLLMYDGNADKAVRNGFILNDRYGEPVTATIKMSDGTIVEENYFIDNEYAFARDIYSDFYPPKEEKAEAESDKQEEKTKEYKPYMIAVDEEKDTVYLCSDKCTSIGMDNFNKEFRAALEGHDNVIVDLRNNGGGIEQYCEMYLYPNLFTDDMTIKQKITLSKNDLTTKWATALYNKQNRQIEENGDETYSYYITYEFEGNADKEYNIYVLTSNSTFSSGDLITSVLGSKDNVTVIGNNTKGEGRDGNVFTALLPESHLIIAYMPGRNYDVNPADAVYGTAPDYYSVIDEETVNKKNEMKENGLNVNEYENRKYWDKTLNMALEMIEK